MLPELMIHASNEQVFAQQEIDVNYTPTRLLALAYCIRIVQSISNPSGVRYIYIYIYIYMAGYHLPIMMKC